MDVERLESSAYAPNKGLHYVDIHKLHELYEKLAFRANLILVGPKGSGKSLSVAAFAAEKDCPVVTFDCSEDIRRSHLVGTFILRGDQTPFVLGPLTTALEIANEKGRCILILEEISGLTPQVQKLLNPVTDWRRKIEVPEAKRVFSLKDKAQLWVVGTMNTAGYSGVYELNEDLKSRFRMIPVEYPKDKDEKEVLSSHCERAGIKLDADSLKKLLTLAKETRQGTYDYALSTRDLIQIIEDASVLDVKQALWIATGKFEGDDRTTVLKRIESVFGKIAP